MGITDGGAIMLIDLDSFRPFQSWMKKYSTQTKNMTNNFDIVKTSEKRFHRLIF